MGSRGPAPKREDQRRRRNKREDGLTVRKAPGAAKVPVPRADDSWHPAAKRWYQSLARSGQSAFYEPSDWATAWVLAELISRELLSGGQLSGSALSAWLKGMASLLATEGDRRRAAVELTRSAEPASAESAGVTSLDAWKGRAQL